MILVAVLLGIALCVAAGAIFGRPAVVALATAFALLVVIGVASDVRAAWRDRAIGRRRLRAMRENDALNRILGEHRRG